MVREQDVIRPRKVTNFKVAFTLNGRMCEQVYDYMLSPYHINQYSWEDNRIFIDILEYKTYQGSAGGNSRIILHSHTFDKYFNMFMSDFDEVILAKKFINNKIYGNFCFCKKGSAQGVRMIFEDP